jgi:hypothetical protein
MSDEAALKSLLAPGVVTNDAPAQSAEGVDSTRLADDDPSPATLTTDSYASPMTAATAVLEGYLQLHLFVDQRTAINNYAAAPLQTYSCYYYKSKSILKVMEDATYCPKNCKVNINFQPLEIIVKSPAYVTLSDKMDDVSKRMNAEIGKLWIQGRVQNNNGLKSYLVRLFAKAIALFAKLFLVDVDVEAFREHVLVAELLLRHHKDFLFHFNNISLDEFIVIYKEVNATGR